MNGMIEKLGKIFDKSKKPISSTAEQIMNEIKYSNKWLYVSFVVYFSDKMSDTEIDNIGEDITNIVNNTHSIFNSKHKFVGHINPYLGIDSILTYEKATEDMVMGHLTRGFSPIIDITERGWKINILPLKDPHRTYTNIRDCDDLHYNIINDVNLYSLENLDNDMWILAGASNFICEKYGIEITEEHPSFNPLIDQIPIIELHDHLLVIKYSIQDRIESAKENPDLDKFILGQNAQDVFELIDLISMKEPNSNWVKAVKKNNLR